MSIPRTSLPMQMEITGDRQTQAMQQVTDSHRRAINQRGSAPTFTDAVTFTAGQTQVIDHKLGRIPTEWVAIDVIDGFGSFQRMSWDAKSISIQSAAACTARFRVA